MDIGEKQSVSEESGKRWPKHGDPVVLTWGQGETAGEEPGEVVRVGSDHFVARTKDGAELTRRFEGSGWRWPGEAENLPKCIECGRTFANPVDGDVCCVCLEMASAPKATKEKCSGCGKLRVIYSPSRGLCRKCHGLDVAAREAEAEGEDQAAGVAMEAARALRTTHGKNGVPELPAVQEPQAGPPEAVCAGCTESGPASELTGGLCKACAPSFPPPAIRPGLGEVWEHCIDGVWHAVGIHAHRGGGFEWESVDRRFNGWTLSADQVSWRPRVVPPRVCKGKYGNGPEDDCGAILGSDVHGDYCARCLRFQAARADVLRSEAPPNRVARVDDVLDEAFEAAWVALAESPALDPTTVAACKRLHDMIWREGCS